MEIRESILKGADAFDARNRFDEEGRKAYMNGSEALSCIRKQWYKKNGAEADGPEDWGFARRGSHGEIYIVERLKLANVPLLFAGDEQVRIVDEDLQLSCTPDGLIWDDDGWIGVEFKTIDPRTNVSNLPRTEHVTQLQIGMAMFEKHREEFPELGDAPIKYGKMVYMNASNFNDIREMRVPLKKSVLDQLKGRASRLLKAKDASRLAREGKENGGRECAQRCAFNKVCGVDGASTSTGQGRKGTGDISNVVATYADAKGREEAAKADKTSAAEQLKALLQREGVAIMEVDGHTVSLSQRAGSVSYAKVVKEHCPDVDLEAYRGQPSEVLTVK